MIRALLRRLNPFRGLADHAAKRQAYASIHPAVDFEAYDPATREALLLTDDPWLAAMCAEARRAENEQVHGGGHSRER